MSGQKPLLNLNFGYKLKNFGNYKFIQIPNLLTKFICFELTQLMLSLPCIQNYAYDKPAHCCSSFKVGLVRTTPALC